MNVVRTEVRKARGRGLSIASLVLGILSLFATAACVVAWVSAYRQLDFTLRWYIDIALLFMFLVGLPAVIMGAVAYAQKRLGRRMAFAGMILGLACSLGGPFLDFRLSLPVMGPSMSPGPSEVIRVNMCWFQTALEVYAADHRGDYPGPDVSWRTGDGQGMAAYLPGGDPLGFDSGPIAGKFPTNPYTRNPYEYGKDLFYFPSKLASPGLGAVTSAANSTCPFVGLKAPGGRKGTIIILGHTRLSGQVDEYAIVGYGRDTRAPAFNFYMGKDTVYFVLHN
jgi:hypothetical protein